MIFEKLLEDNYGLKALAVKKTDVGAGSDTYFVTCAQGRYVVKFPCESSINDPVAEPELCAFLLSKGLPVCRFLRNSQGGYVSRDADGRIFHVQEFVEGYTPELNSAPDWLLRDSARMLGRIHTALLDYPRLAEGIGAGFFKFMTPASAARSYAATMDTAQARGDAGIAGDLN